VPGAHRFVAALDVCPVIALRRAWRIASPARNADVSIQEIML